MTNGVSMKHFKMIYFLSLLVFLSLIISRCSGGSDEDSGGQSGGGDATQRLVTFRGRVDDGLGMSPLANAQCRFTNLNGGQLATVTADSHGEFHFDTSPDMQGW